MAAGRRDREIPYLALEVAPRGLGMTAHMSSTDWGHGYGRCPRGLNGLDSAAAGSPTVGEQVLVAAVAGLRSPVVGDGRARRRAPERIQAWRGRWLPGRQSGPVGSR